MSTVRPASLALPPTVSVPVPLAVPAVPAPPGPRP